MIVIMYLVGNGLFYQFTVVTGGYKGLLPFRETFSIKIFFAFLVIIFVLTTLFNYAVSSGVHYILAETLYFLLSLVCLSVFIVLYFIHFVKIIKPFNPLLNNNEKDDNTSVTVKVKEKTSNSRMLNEIKNIGMYVYIYYAYTHKHSLSLTLSFSLSQFEF